jgi:hypothetical protein
MTEGKKRKRNRRRYLEQNKAEAETNCQGIAQANSQNSKYYRVPLERKGNESEILKVKPPFPYVCIQTPVSGSKINPPNCIKRHAMLVRTARREARKGRVRHWCCSSMFLEISSVVSGSLLVHLVETEVKGRMRRFWF